MFGSGGGSDGVIADVGSGVPLRKLAGANLQDAILVFADLGGADLRGADLSGAMLGVADLSRADLTDAKNLNQSRLDQACGTDAKLPPGLTLKLCPAK